jgi:hypothetical protein
VALQTIGNVTSDHRFNMHNGELLQPVQLMVRFCTNGAEWQQALGSARCACSHAHVINTLHSRGLLYLVLILHQFERHSVFVHNRNLLFSFHCPSVSAWCIKGCGDTMMRGVTMLDHCMYRC